MSTRERWSQWLTVVGNGGGVFVRVLGRILLQLLNLGVQVVQLVKVTAVLVGLVLAGGALLLLHTAFGWLGGAKAEGRVP